MSVGPDPVQQLISQYLPDQQRSQGLLDDLLEDETDKLLYALVKETRDERVQTANPSNETTGTYYHEKMTLDDGRESRDLDITPTEWGLRFDKGIKISFKGNLSRDAIPYRAQDSPVTPPVTASTFEIEALNDGEEPTVYIEGWV